METYLKKNLDFSKTITGRYIEKYGYPDVLAKIDNIISELAQNLDLNEYQDMGNQVYIHKSVKLDPSAKVIGPCLIEEGTEIRVGAFLRGKVIIGKNCVIGNSTEIKNSILFDEVKVPHFNYIGDSILGYKVHFGAGSLTSNVKSDETLVKLTIAGKTYQTNRKKIGAIVGNKVEIGCNAVLTPGAIIGANSTIYPLTMVRGEIEPNKIVKSMNNIVSKE